MDTTNFATASRELAEAARRQPCPHPALDELTAYLEGRLVAGPLQRLRNHLAICPRCAATVLELARFHELETRDEPVEPAAPHVLDWATLRARLEHEQLLSHPSPIPSPSAQVEIAASRYRRTPVIAWALAASVLLLLAQGFWVSSLYRQARQNAAPRINVEHYDLLPLGSELSRQAETARAERIALRGDAAVLLVLNLAEHGAWPDYRLELLHARGRDAEPPIWRAEHLEPGHYGTFNLELPGDFLPPGDYELRLYGAENDRSELLARYRLDIEED